MSPYDYYTCQEWAEEFNYLRFLPYAVPRLLHESAVISPENPTADTTNFEESFKTILWHPDTVKLSPENMCHKNPAIQVQFMQLGYTILGYLIEHNYPALDLTVK